MIQHDTIRYDTMGESGSTGERKYMEKQEYEIARFLRMKNASTAHISICKGGKCKHGKGKLVSTSPQRRITQVRKI